MKRICIGKIKSAHGIKGLVKIAPYCEDLSFLEGKIFISENGTDAIDISIKSSAGKFLLAEIKEITDRNGAEEISGTELFAEENILPEIDTPDTFYISDLIGLKALNTEGQEIGKVIAVEDFGAGDLLEIKPLEGETYYIPFKNQTVPDIDIQKGTITIANHKEFILT